MWLSKQDTSKMVEIVYEVITLPYTERSIKKFKRGSYDVRGKYCYDGDLISQSDAEFNKIEDPLKYGYKSIMA